MISDSINNLIILLEKKFEVDRSIHGGAPNVDLKTKFSRFIHGTKELTNRADTEIKPTHLLKAVGTDAANVVGLQIPSIGIVSHINKNKNKPLKHIITSSIKSLAKDTIKEKVPGYHTANLLYNTGQSGRKATFNTNRLANAKAYLDQRAQRSTKIK